MSAGDRWYRQGEWPIWHFDSKSAEWLRLERACYASGVSIVHLSVAAHILADRADLDLSEAWDRLAFNLERMVDGRWPTSSETGAIAVIKTRAMGPSCAVVHSSVSQEMSRC